MIFSRNNIEYFRLDGANNIVNVETSKSLSSNYLYCNYLRTRTLATNDMIFEGSKTVRLKQTPVFLYILLMLN